MKFFALAAAVTPLLMASTTLARSPLPRGENTDTCAQLDADLVFPDVEVEDKPYNAGHIHIGLCVSRVEAFVGHYNVTKNAINVVGVDRVKAAIIDMIKKAGVECSYPLHARPSVTKKNVCDFVCADGFWALPASHPSSCICPPYLTECNGQCGHFPNCSPTPPPSRRQNEPKCAQDLTMCGVPGATSGEAFKCTNVMSDSYTCGGCIKPSLFDNSPAVGVNCHELPGVKEVSCKAGECFVEMCKEDFKISASKHACIAVPHEKSTRALPMPDTQHLDSTGVPAKAVDFDGIKAIAGNAPRSDAALGVKFPVNGAETLSKAMGTAGTRGSQYR